MALFALRAAIVTLAAIAPLFGQTAQATGRVVDGSGAIVPGVEVTAVKINAGVIRRATTNEQGLYVIPFLSPGEYEIRVERTGFKPIRRQGVRLAVDEASRLDFTLEVGEQSERVVVVGEAPLLATETASLKQVIGGRRILDLPLNGRDFTQLATLVPGATTGSGSGWLPNSNLNVNGSRKSKAMVAVDGISVSNQQFDGASLTPSVDAVQEFSVQSSTFSAEYGQGTSVVNVSLRSGGNELHGSAFHFLRNQALDARNFFNASSVRPALRQNQFGFTLGGPVTMPGVYRGRNRTFFFIDFQESLNRRPITRNLTVPTAAMKQGDFSGRTVYDPLATTANPASPGNYLRQAFPGSLIPASRFSSQATYYLKYFPDPNTASGTYNYSPGRRNDNYRFDIRLDHQISANNALQGGYSMQQGDNYTPGNLPQNGALTESPRSQMASLRDTHTFGPALINELRLGYVRDSTVFTSPDLTERVNHTVLSGIGGFDEQSQSFPGFPHLAISGYTGINGLAFYPLIFRHNKYELIDSITVARGAHFLKVGMNLRRYSTAGENGATSRGSFTFNGGASNNAFADFLLGAPQSGQRSFPRNLGGVRSAPNEHFFLQDDWKATSRLTLNLGLRYELNHPIMRVNNQMVSTDPVLRRMVVTSDSEGRFTGKPIGGQQVSEFLFPMFADIIIPSSQAGLSPALRNLDANNFAPRFGLAWRPGLKDLVVRGGYGIYYGLIQSNRLDSTLSGPPFTADESGNLNSFPLVTKTLANMFAPTSSGLYLTPLSFYQTDPNMRDPYFQQWNVTLQKAFGRVLSLEASYVGNKGTKLESSRPINVPDPGPGAVQNRRAWTRFAGGNYVEDSGGSTYNALQAKAEVREWRGLTLLASYAWAKAIDDGTSDPQGSTVQDPNNLRAEKGPADIDIRHRFVASFVYRLPFGGRGWRRIAADWQVGSIVSLRTGLPMTPTIGADTAGTGRTNMRPDRVGTGVAAVRTLEMDFDLSAFRTPASYTYGSAGRNPIYRRPVRSWDFIASRRFRLHERTQLEFRAEFFNFTNTPAFDAPGLNIQAVNAGRIQSAGEPRDVQLALKLHF